ncbi:MAG: DUF6867 family protein [Rhodoplanes sp.]|jgi:Domain of unknown function (DUF6867)
MDTFVGGDPLVVLLVSVIFGGGCAWLAARAIALTWRPRWQLVFYMFILGLAVRFLHYALFERALLDPLYYAIDTGILLVIGLSGYRYTRRQQMARQYGFLVRPGRRPQP